MLPRLIICLSILAGGPLTAAEPVKVFVLAGQSNMQGQGVVDLDHPQHYNGGKGILERVIRRLSRLRADR